MATTLLRFAFCLGLASTLVAGCAKARAAATVPDGPPLAVPVPPARVVGPVEDPPQAGVPAEPEVAPVPEAPATASRQPARRAASPPPAERAAEPAPAQPVSDSPRELRAASTPADAEVEKKVRALLASSSRNLNLVDYRRLSAAGREQYDQAKGFERQAEEALTERNYVFAQTLADKAATLAAELSGR